MALNKADTNSLSDNAVTTEKIEDGAVTAGKLAAGNLSVSKTLLLNAAPTITSLNTSQINPDSGATVTITGTGFVSIPDVRFLNTSTGVRIQASTIGFTSSTTITAAFPSGQTVGTYKVLVENPDGKGVISTSTITYSAAPTWSTAANLGSIEEGESVNIQLLAYDDDSTAVSSYSLVSGSLPSGVTLSGDSSVGALTGTAPEVDADTNYTFTIRATDDESQTSDREFTLTITNWTVANSLRFNSGSSDYLTRTPSGTGNRRTWTFSAWVKRTNPGAGNQIFQQSQAEGNYMKLYFSSDKIFWRGTTGGSNTAYIVTNRLFRDVSAWYHIVARFDSTNATAGDRMRLYINGIEETDFSTDINPSLNYDSFANTTNPIDIGRDNVNNASYFNGYMAEVCMVDGQSLDPTSFGETDTASGIWKPKKISGLTFGTNGLYLPFTSSGSLGADSSGNSNDFTVNNLTAVDQSTDTPQNNFITMNPLDSYYSASTFSEGNLKVVTNSGSYTTNTSTIALASGKWFWEVKVTNSSTEDMIGIRGDQTRSNYDFNESYDFFYNSYGRFYDGSSGSQFVSYGATFTTGDIIGVALDLDSGTNTIQFYKNGVAQGSKNITHVSSTAIGFYNIAVGDYTSGGASTFEMNFGSPPYSESGGNSDGNGYGNFSMAVPSGYFALNTKNLAEYG
jgi:hypothetical protein